MVKRCGACAVERPAEAFSRGNGRLGLQNYCKPCSTTKNREYRRRPGPAAKNRARMREYGRKNSARTAERARSYVEANPEAPRVWQAAHRAREAGVTSTLTLSEWLDVLDEFSRMCAYCGAHFETIDHVVPMSRGGANSAENTVPACAFCNNSKHDRTPEEWGTAVRKR